MTQPLLRLLHTVGSGLGIFGAIARLIFGQRIAAVMGLTWKAAFRFRLFLVVAGLLLASVVLLPILIKDDGTARGFTQILLTYTLSTITGLLGISTLWLACGTLARDIEECQLQMVATKPIARWQIWAGKWLGIMSLNAALLGISALSVYLLLQWRATKLPAEEQAVLRNEIMVARGSARPKNVEEQIKVLTEQELKERLQKSPVAAADVAEVRKQLREQIKASYEQVLPGYSGQWQIDLGFAKNFLKGRPMQMRIKFNSADKSPSGTFQALWRFGVPRKTHVAQSTVMSLAPDTFHEFEIPADLFDDQGILTVAFANANNTTLIFPMDEGIEVLYQEGSFGPNFARGAGVIFCWMGLLAALGLFAASFLSFPVAAFFAVGVLALVFSTKTLENAVSEGTIGGYNAEKGTAGHLMADNIVIPIFKHILEVIEVARHFSPVDALSTGRNISWGQLGLAFVEIVLLLGGPIALMGMGILTRRELATAQGTQ